MTPQQEQQRQHAALNEWEREDAIRKTTMKTLLLFLWTNRHALAALIIKTLEAKLKEESRQPSIAEICARIGTTGSIPTVHDTASAILEAKK